MKELDIIQLFKNIHTDRDMEIGIGDDCAVLKGSKPDYDLLVTTDMLIEGTHFLRNQISASELANKALAVNLSDIAAMGGNPTYVFLSCGFPKDLSDQWITEFALEFKKKCEDYNVKLVGGDTNLSLNGIVVNITVQGEVKKENLKLRSTAKPSNLICVTGFVGDSKAGLQCLQNNLKIDSSLQKALIEKHFVVHPQIKPGQLLGQQSSVTAMMDVSDGLFSDVLKLVTASNVSAKIQVEQLPISEELDQFCKQTNRDPMQMAVLGGEDYVLLCCIQKDYFLQMQKLFRDELKTELFCIGEIIKKETVESEVSFLKNGEKFEFTESQFEHF